MAAAAGLNTGLFIRGKYVVVRPQARSVPHAGIEIEDASGLLSKLGIARENPAPMTPRLDGILTQPPPQCRAPDVRDQTAFRDVAANLGPRKAREGLAESLRQFTGERFDGDDDFGGKSAPVRHHGEAHRDRAGGTRRSAYATC
jgi:hypothetical protein